MTGPGGSRRPELGEDAIRFLRRRITATFANSSAPAPIGARMIAENIAFGAAVLGASHVELVDRDGWWFVASEFNWLGASRTHHGELELFEKMLAFPEQSPTSHRAEIYVTAFAAQAYFRIGEAVTWIRGEDRRGALPDAGVTPPWCDTVLAFSLPGDAGGTA